MESRCVSEEPGRHNAANVHCGQADRDPRCAAVMWLYVGCVLYDEASRGGIATYNLKI